MKRLTQLSRCGVLALSLLAVPAFSQTPRDPNATPPASTPATPSATTPNGSPYSSDSNMANRDNTDRGDHNFGWIGLIGLAGLIGLFRHNTGPDRTTTNTTMPRV